MFKGTSFGRLRWLVPLLAVIVLALAFGQGAALAADFGTTTVNSANPKFTWNSTLAMTNFLQPGDPGTVYGTPCPDPTIDSFTCDSLNVKTTQAGSRLLDF